MSKSYELTAAGRTGLVARGEVPHTRLTRLAGLVINVSEKTEPTPDSPQGFRVTEVVTSASAISHAFRERAKQKAMAGGSGEQDEIDAEWWGGYAAGAHDASIGAFKYSPTGVKEFAAKKATEGDRLEAAKWNGYAAAMFRRPGEGIPHGGEIILPITAGREIAH